MGGIVGVCGMRRRDYKSPITCKVSILGSSKSGKWKEKGVQMNGQREEREVFISSSMIIQKASVKQKQLGIYITTFIL